MLSRFFDSVIENDVEKLRWFLQNGADTNATIDRHKLTPLHFAVFHNSADAAELGVAGAFMLILAVLKLNS